MRVAPMMTRLASALAIAGLAGVANAQAPARTLIRVTARDSTGAVVPAAELTVTRGLHDIIARGTTDDGGHAVLPVEIEETEDLQVTMRKIGYARGDRFFEARPQGTTDVTITVARRPHDQPRSGDGDRSDATPSARAITSTPTRSTPAHVFAENAWELIKRLRPDMLTSRGGCDSGVREVWVNGKRIRLPLYPTGMAAARALVGVPPRAAFTYVPVSVLSDIAPEHILGDQLS